MVGGKLQNRGMGNLAKMVKGMKEKMDNRGGNVSGGANEMSGCGLSGGNISGGKKSASKLAKHLF
jgi:hypothetical protein